MKEKFNELKLMFTRISTQIFLLDSVGLLLFKGKEAKLYATEVLIILGIAAICSVLYVLLLYDKDVSKKTMFLLQLVYFVIMDAVVLIIGYFLHWYSFCRIESFFALESVIVGVILITILYSYKTNSIIAKKINEKLKALEQESEK